MELNILRRILEVVEETPNDSELGQRIREIYHIIKEVKKEEIESTKNELNDKYLRLYTERMKLFPL